jgi:hypothetical protein
VSDVDTVNLANALPLANTPVWWSVGLLTVIWLTEVVLLRTSTRRLLSFDSRARRRTGLTEAALRRSVGIRSLPPPGPPQRFGWPKNRKAEGASRTETTTGHVAGLQSAVPAASRLGWRSARDASTGQPGPARRRNLRRRHARPGLLRVGHPRWAGSGRDQQPNAERGVEPGRYCQIDGSEFAGAQDPPQIANGGRGHDAGQYQG